MASASSDARRKEEISSGMSMGTSAFTRFISPPLSMSAPLAFLSAHYLVGFLYKKVGINRRAMVIIMARE